MNKNAAANDATVSFKTGFSARALFGTLGSDDFTLKVSPNGSSFFDALVADRNTGRVRFPVGVALTGLAADPGSPTDGWLWHNSTTGQLRARLGGIRHSSTAILSAWASTATPDLNGGTPVTTARKVLRRTLAYATAAPGTWGLLTTIRARGPMWKPRQFQSRLDRISRRRASYRGHQ